MNRHRRLDKMVERHQACHGETSPLTLFLVEADAEHPVGTRVIWGGRGREIVYDPTQGEPALPPGGPHKIVLGPELEV
jgi:hypothetical protein